MATLFDNIADFFEGLFNSDPQALKAKRALREQTEVLSEVRPAVYSARSEQILSGFAQSWGTVHTLLQPLRDLFDLTLSHTDRKIQMMSLAWVIESVLVGEIGERRLSLAYEALKERFNASSDFASESANATAEFNSLLLDLRRQDTDGLQRELEGLFRLKNLASHSLIPMLTKMGYSGASSSQNYHAVDATAIISDLLDLYFVIEGLELDVGVERLLGLLLERVGPNRVAENRKKTGALLNRLRDLNRGPCSPYLLLHLIRVIQRDPESQPEVHRFPERFVQQYSATLSERFTADRERALREHQESSLDSDVSALFPNTPLLNLEHYTDQTSQSFTEMALPPLSVTRPLQILKSFCYAVLKTGYLDSVKLVVLNGFLLDKEWGQRLSDALYAAEKTNERIEAFDASLETDTKCGFPALEKYLEGKVPVSSVPKQMIEKLNRNATAALEEEAKVLQNLAQRVGEILSDYKLPQPQFVGNIKGLGGKDQRAMLEGLIGGYNRTAQLLRILKHFVVVR